MVRSSFVVAMGDTFITHVGHDTLESAMAHAAELKGPYQVLEFRNEIVVHRAEPRQGVESSTKGGG